MSNLNDIIFYSLVACGLVEQIFYWFSRSYPYRYGLVIKTLEVDNFDIHYWAMANSEFSTLKIMTNVNNDEVCLRYKFPLGVIGPLLFIGQIKRINSKGILQIKVGQLTAFFLLFLIGYSIFSENFLHSPIHQVINLFCLCSFIAYGYFAILIPIKKLIRRSPGRNEGGP